MFESIKRLWDTQKIDEPALRKAVAVKGWISQEQYKEISGKDYE
ncbi:XkdX family protein [Paenibacillus sp. NRS-1760]